MAYDEWFLDQPVHWRAIADAVIDHLTDLGDIAVDPVEVGILVKRSRTFVEMRPVRADLRLSMLHSRPIDDPRLVRRVQVSNSRFAHFVDLACADDVDDQVVDWLTEAFFDSPP